MNIFFKIIPILLIIFSAIICTVKPTMHKSMMMYNSEYIIKQPENEETKTVFSNTIPEVKNREISPVKQEIPISRVKVATPSVKPKQKEISKKEHYPEAKVATVQPKEDKKAVEKQIQKERLEEIQWNIWRSNLHNQIMKDVKLPIMPQGAIFKFSFEVDKFGRISNVQTWSTTPNLTPYAIQYIAPVIRSYQGKPILNFPQGSNRVITKVDGAWKISNSSKYATPQDYNDSEVIKHR